MKFDYLVLGKCIINCRVSRPIRHFMLPLAKIMLICLVMHCSGFVLRPSLGLSTCGLRTETASKATLYVFQAGRIVP